MVEKFHEELDVLKENVLAMGFLAERMLTTSVEALKDLDLERAQWVMSQKDALADYDENIEEDALRLIALYQPMAKDMRTIACCLKMITYIARIGRYGKDIAKVTLEFPEKEHITRLVSIPQMGRIVEDMIDDALTAFKNDDLSPLEDFCKREDDVDTLRYSIFREAISYMMEDSKYITRCAHYIMISRYLERCADHACKMAEKIHYMITGERIEIR
jgi:phosphate transport system protein